MTKILMVCMGNICRSPLAQGIMENKARAFGLSLEIDSAGTISYHAGEPPDYRAQHTAKKHHIDISRQKARQLSKNDIEYFDHIFVMDHSNYQDAIRIAGNSPHRGRIKLITEYAFPGKGIEVPDPYYGGDDGFDKVYHLLDKSCEAIAVHIGKSDH